jgi:hypothetical protein
MDTLDIKQRTQPTIDQDSEVKTAISLSLSINDVEFDLVYNAREESFDGTPAHIASGIVNFAKQSNCTYVMLSGNDCWVSTHKGISLLAQIESDQSINHYDIVVLPLDDAIYIAELNDLLVLKERVQHIDQAIELLSDQTGRIAVLPGGRMQLALENHGYAANVKKSIFIAGKDVTPYRFQMLSWVLIKNRLFHLSLLIPVGIILGVLLLIITLSVSLTIDKPKMPVKVQPSIKPQLSIEVSEPPPVTGKNFNNNAAQMLESLAPWLTGSGFDFLKTCRLLNVDINDKQIIFTGEKMDNTQMSLIGCGYQRLKQVIQERQLQLLLIGYNWIVTVKVDPMQAQRVPSAAYVQTMDRLKLLAAYIGWDFSIPQADFRSSNVNNQRDQSVRVVFSGDHLEANTLAAFTEVFMDLPADFEKGTLILNPETLSLVRATFEISVHTISESAQ